MKVELGDIFIAFEMDIVFMENMTKSDLEMNDNKKRDWVQEEHTASKQYLWTQRVCF